MTTKRHTLRIGGRDVVLVPGASVEQWWEEHARSRLHAIASEWPGREALLRLSDDTLGPSDDIDAAIEHLVRVLDRGDLVAVRIDEHNAAASTRASDAAWDGPRLADLPGDRPRARSDGPRPATRSTSEMDPRSVDPSSTPHGASERSTDTWSTFVAFVVVDQDGKPLAGESRCTIAGTKHVHPLGEVATEIEPIAAHARVLLELADLAPKGEASP